MYQIPVDETIAFVAIALSKICGIPVTKEHLHVFVILQP